MVPPTPSIGKALQCGGAEHPAADEGADDADDDVAEDAVSGAADDERGEDASDETDDEPGENVHDVEPVERDHRHGRRGCARCAASWGRGQDMSVSAAVQCVSSAPTSPTGMTCSGYRPLALPARSQLGLEDVAAQRDALVAQRDAVASEQLLDLRLELAAPRAYAGRRRSLAAAPRRSRRRPRSSSDVGTRNSPVAWTLSPPPSDR